MINFFYFSKNRLNNFFSSILDFAQKPPLFWRGGWGGPTYQRSRFYYFSKLKTFTVPKLMPDVIFIKYFPEGKSSKITSTLFCPL